MTGIYSDKRYSIGNASFCGLSHQTDSGDVYLCEDGVPVAKFEIERALRTDAKTTVNELRSMGLKVHLLSGDSYERCETVSAELSIPFRADETPESKQHYLSTLDGVLFVGDGLNDLPALASADASLATMETVDLVKLKSDALLMTDKLAAISTYFKVGVRCRRAMTQNLYWALGYNLIAIPIAVSGWATPWLAALGMSLSSLVVMANSTRLLRD